jgi:hypothetical protein
VGVTPAFVEEMRRQGLSAQNPDDAVEGRAFVQSANGRGDRVAGDVGREGPVAVAGGHVSVVGPHGPVAIAVPPPRAPDD